MSMLSRNIDFYTRSFDRDQYERTLDLIISSNQRNLPLVVTPGEGLCRLDTVEKIIALIKSLFGFYTGRERERIGQEVLSFLFWGEREGFFSDQRCVEKIRQLTFRDKMLATLVEKILHLQDSSLSIEGREATQALMRSLLLEYQRRHPTIVDFHHVQAWVRKLRRRKRPQPQEVGGSFLQAIDRWKSRRLIIQERVDRIAGFYQRAISMNSSPAFLEKALEHAESIRNRVPPRSSAQREYHFIIAKICYLYGSILARRGESTKSLEMIERCLDSLRACSPDKIPLFVASALKVTPEEEVLKRLIGYLSDPSWGGAYTRQIAFLSLHLGEEKESRGDFLRAKRLLKEAKGLFADQSIDDQKCEYIEKKLEFYRKPEAQILSLVLQSSSIPQPVKREFCLAKEGGGVLWIDKLKEYSDEIALDSHVTEECSEKFFQFAQTMQKRWGPKNIFLESRSKDIPLAAFYYAFAIFWESEGREQKRAYIQKFLNDLNVQIVEKKQRLAEESGKNELPRSVACHPLLIAEIFIKCGEHLGNFPQMTSFEPEVQKMIDEKRKQRGNQS